MFESVDRVLAQHEAGLPEFLISPELADVRTDARYVALRAKLNLPPHD
jgi:hypothetical protein